MTNTRRHFLRAAGGASLALLGGAVPRAQAFTPGPNYANQGIDVSHWQGAINWASVKNAGIKFAFMKATEGTTFVDSRFATNWAAAKKNGIIRGAYHFGRPASSATAQADHFINTVKPTSGDLQMTLDLEVTDSKTPAQIWTWVQAFIGRIRSRTGRPGIIYTGYYFWRDRVGNPTSNLNCPLWLAYWGSGDPANYVPRAWSYFSFWQYTSSGRVPGISGNVDRDAWNGTYANLLKLRLP